MTDLLCLARYSAKVVTLVEYSSDDPEVNKQKYQLSDAAKAADETVFLHQPCMDVFPLTKFKLKNRHWWNSGKTYHRINFVVKVSLGPAEISVELWYNGAKVSKDNLIKVE
jgi:hypothetical protein